MAELERYGTLWNTDNPAMIELACIAKGGQWVNAQGNTCGLGKVQHSINFQRMTWEDKDWHRWNRNLILPELVKQGRLALFGPSSTGKSFECSCQILTEYYARPNCTTGIVSTTTVAALDNRIFGEIKRLHKEAKKVHPWLPGFLIDSRHCIVTDPKGKDEGRDFRNGILGVPCKRGNEWQSLSEYVGIKNDVVIVAADESHLMQSGFWNGMANLLSNNNARIWALGNLNDLGSPLGKAAEPKLGWDSLPDTETSRVYETRWFEGRALQLIGLDSPNLDYPDGQEPYPKLIGRRYINQCRHDYGEDTVYFQMFASGKIPRSSMTKTVFTRLLALKNMANEDVVWGSEPIVKLYAMDAAYGAVGGDRTCGAPFAYGPDVGGELRFAMIDRPKVYTGSPDKRLSHEDFIADQAKEQCEMYGIPPERFYFDGTGRSSLTASLMKRWSTQVVPIEFGGNATERPNFLGFKYQEDSGDYMKGDLKPCRDIFGKFVSELWFASVACINAGQLRGITLEMIEEGCQRLWSDFAYGFRGKLTVEPKKGTKEKPGMTERMGRSPDLWDMLVTGLEGARRLGFMLGRLAPESEKRGRAGVAKWLIDLEKAQRERNAKLLLARN